MMNMTLINQVANWVAKAYEAELITETTESIMKRTINWYNHTDITEFEVLAAAVWLGDYSIAIEYDTILATREMLFPQIPIEFTNFHIGEIEEALRDEFWF